MRNVYTGKYLFKWLTIIGLIYLLVALPVTWLLFHNWLFALSWGIMGFIFIGIGVYYRLKDGLEHAFDERSRRITWKAGFYAFFIYVLLLGTLASLQAAGIVNIGYGLIIWLIWFSMPWTFLIFRFIFDRSGEEI